MENLKTNLNEFAILKILNWNIAKEDKPYIDKDYKEFFNELLGDFVRDLILIQNKSDDKNNILAKDEDFKSIYKYRVVLALLLKYSLLEFKNMSIFKILSLIPSEKDNFSVVKEINSESINTEAKLIKYDLVFDMKIPEGLATITITVNVEHQGDYPISYPIKKRMVYYNARKIDKQLNYADGEDNSADYSKVHKVYTIWFCLGNIYKDDNCIIHRKVDGIVKSIDGEQKDKDFDMSEIVIIEYKKLVNAIKEEESNKKSADTINKKSLYHLEEITPEARLLYYLTKNEIDKTVKGITECLNVDVEVRKKEASKMKSVLELYADQREQQGEQRGLQRGFQRGEQKRLQELVTAINNGSKENLMPNILSSILSVSYDFVCYVENYFKANLDKTDEENVNTLVAKIMNGEISMK